MGERIAVYICDCMGLVSDYVDTASLERLAGELADVALVRRVGMLCGSKELDGLAAELEREGLERLLFAGCSPRMSLKLPEELLVSTAGRAGIDPSFVEVANIREQCAWIHRQDRDGASRKARDTLRMAHARLSGAEPAAEPIPLERRVLVVGAGPAGLAAARDLARDGCPATLVERQPAVGGTLCQLPFMFQTECWPSTCESACVGPVQAQAALLERQVTLHTSARLERLESRDGNFEATIELQPRYVDPDRCISCGLCEEACPEVGADPFELGRAARKAIARPAPRAVPESFHLLAEACTFCGDCVEVCPTGAIDLEAEAATVTERAGAVILATGTKLRDPASSPELGSVSPDVLTSLEMERMLASREIALPSSGEAPEHIVFVQCAGSRATEKQGEGVPYCSKTCCAATAKQAKRLASESPMTEVSVIYYRDFRGYERALEKLHQDLRAMGIEFHNGDVTAIAPREEGGLAVELDLLGTEELEDEGANETIECDMVVLACAHEPRMPAAAGELRVPTDAFGFPIEAQPRIFRPTETFVDRVFAVGSAAGPKVIQQSAEQGTVAALRALEALREGVKRPVKHSSSVDQQRCSRCGVCVSVCPHGAVKMTDEGAASDPAFCQGCGMCAASCASHAAALRNFGDAQLLREVRAAFAEPTAGEPRILALLCYWCSYGAADLAGEARIEAPDCFRSLRVRCSSSVNLGLIVEIFRLGVDGVLVSGCPHNSCHHMWGNWLADKRVALMKGLLRQMGLDERRLIFDNLGIMHAQQFVERIERMRGELAALGPNPWTAADGEGGRAPAAGEAPWLTS